MNEDSANMLIDSTPHASLGNDEADQAGSCPFWPKTPLSTAQLAERMLAKGFRADRAEELAEYLESRGFYHLRGYWLTLEHKRNFTEDATLEALKDIVSFDEAIASFILSLVSHVEVALRSRLATALSLAYGPGALHDPAAFRDANSFAKMQRTVERETAQALASKKPLALHHIRKYGALPIWAELENSSLGTVSNAYGNLADNKIAESIASGFGITRIRLKNWLKHLTYIRNICAHQDRLYNKLLTVKPKLFKEHGDLGSSRLFPTFIVLLKLHDAIRPEDADAVRIRLRRIVLDHPGVDLGPVGFPEGWMGILGIPEHPADEPRARGRNGGRPPKDPSALERALFMYDAKRYSIKEICEATGVGTTTLYKYINQRRECGERIEYASTELP